MIFAREVRFIDGEWMIIDDHVSVPVDSAAARPCLDLKP